MADLISSGKCNKYHLYWEEAGSGHAVVFIHGGQEDYRIFLPQLDLLKSDLRVVTYSRRYNYPNPAVFKKETPYNPFTEARDLNVLLNKLDLDSVHLVGHSFGGLVAMGFADLFPNKLKSLTLSEPPCLSLQGCEAWLAYIQRELFEKGRKVAANGSKSEFLSVISKFFLGEKFYYDKDLELLDTLMVNQTEMEALVHSDNPFPVFNTEYNCPVMLITAENTLPILKHSNKILLTKIAFSSHLHLKDADHNMWITHYKTLAENLTEFFS